MSDGLWETLCMKIMMKSQLPQPAVTFWIWSQTRPPLIYTNPDLDSLHNMQSHFFFLWQSVFPFLFYFSSFGWACQIDRRVRRRIIRGSELSSITSRWDGIRLKGGLMALWRRSLHQHGDCKLVGMRWTAANLVTLQRRLQQRSGESRWKSSTQDDGSGCKI